MVKIDIMDKMFAKITRPIDGFLNTITMYRLMLYFLMFLWCLVLILSPFNIFPFTPLQYLISTAAILITCYITNKFFSLVFKIPTNLESVYISALILIFIIFPFKTTPDLFFIIAASIIAIASKYVLKINKRHIFNPAAIAVFITSLFSLGYATWWIGNQWTLLPILIGGLLIVKKVQRFGMVSVFLITFFIATISFSIINNSDLSKTIYSLVINSPILFFSFVMLVEPLTSPTAKKMQIAYGLLVGILSGWQFNIGPFYSTYEAALIIGNIFAYAVGFKYRLVLILQEKIKLAPSIYEFVFSSSNKFNFSPGQYLEWTLSYQNPDSRGNRRYFTIASSPTEEKLKIGVKFYENSSSFKKKLLSLKNGDRLIAGNLSGDFTLPLDGNKKLVFIAGGIGITPFRSMIKYLLDNNKKLPIIIFYSNKVTEDIVYKHILDAASKKLNIKTIYVLTDTEKIPHDWKGEEGRITAEMIKKYVPDFSRSTFYLSGPHVMIDAYEEVLQKMNIKKNNIKKDFFPGYV